jgi:hypothetical protein
MKLFTLAIIMFAAAVSGCGTAIATAPAPSTASQLQTPKVPEEVASSELAEQNCDGIPDGRCRTYQNMLGPNEVIVEIAFSNRRARPFPMGGRLPLPRLLYRQVTRVGLEGCDRRDENGDCIFVAWARSYETMNLAKRTDDPAMRELLTHPVEKPAYEHCYWKEVTIRQYWDGTPISHHPRFDSVPCPKRTKVAIPAVTAAARP